MKTKITELSYYLPSSVETLDDLGRENPGWQLTAIKEKTGIDTRYVSGDKETALDLALKAAQKIIFDAQKAAGIDLLVLVSQSPEYALPTGACILQDRLGLRTECMAFDINLGCSGFVYALSIASSLIDTGQATKGLIICADTYTKYISVNDRTCRPIFSDGAAATLLEGSQTDTIGPFQFGTDGSLYESLILRGSGARKPSLASAQDRPQLEMNGSSIFMYTVSKIPINVRKLLNRCGLSLQDIDLVIFHQASKVVIESLISKLSLDRTKVFNNYTLVGNTVSSSIPIALKDAQEQGILKKGDLVLLVGFGVGFSWGITIVRWMIK